MHAGRKTSNISLHRDYFEHAVFSALFVFIFFRNAKDNKGFDKEEEGM